MNRNDWTETPARGSVDEDSPQAWRRIAVPPVHSAGFATVLQAPAFSLRKQSHNAVAVACAAMVENGRSPHLALSGALAAIPEARTRVDRGRVAWFATHLLRHLPAGAHLATGIVPRYVAAERAAIKTAPPRPSALFVAYGSSDVLAVRVHPAFRMDAVSDPWMTKLLGWDTQLGERVPGFVGVLVMTPRAPAPGVHCARAGTHLLGGCPSCVTTTQLAGVRS